MAEDGVWRPGPRPGWVRGLHAVGDPAWIRLDPEELLREAQARTGLADFGGDSWREGYRVFLEALEAEARLHLVGRVLARADVLNWLENRLQLTDHRKRHPELAARPVDAPIVVTGLPRTGTSILHELLAQDPGLRAPLAWEVRRPCPPPLPGAPPDRARIERADAEVRFWCDVVPEYDTMHELGAELPVECIQITAHEFASDELSGRHVVPSYAAWLAGADPVPAYRFHRGLLQHLQGEAPARRWVLKAPSHLGRLAALLAVYPDARIVWTHRDPIPVMASVASILFSTAWVRSDQVDAEQVLGWFTGETCAFLLDAAEGVRGSPAARGARFADVRYAELVRDPFATLGRLYDALGLPLSAEAERRMRAYLAAKPKGRHGAHRYDFTHTGFDREAERRRFRAYRERYGVAEEA